MVDLAGTLLSPDQARVSAEAAGVVRAVLVEIGQDVKVGHPAGENRAQGIAARAGPRRKRPSSRRGPNSGCTGRSKMGDNPPPDDQIASVRNAYATYLDAKATSDRIQTLAGRGIVSPL